MNDGFFRSFINRHEWIIAKSYAAFCPHEYIVMKRQPEEEFTSSDFSEELKSWLLGNVRMRMENTDHIREMLPLLEEAVRSDSLLTMINTVLFDAMWQHPYKGKDIEEGVFHNADGTDCAVTMLRGGSSSYVENEYGAGFLKEFQQCGYSFMALLPKEEGSECLKALAANTDFYDLLHHQKYATVYTMMPEFSVSFDETLNGMARSLGIKEAFTDWADFSSISTVPLRADRMIHRAKIKVDRNGARADAATMIVLLTGIPPEEKKYILIDRPFVFAIVHEKLGIPVFTGVVNRIEEG